MAKIICRDKCITFNKQNGCYNFTIYDKPNYIEYDDLMIKQNGSIFNNATIKYEDNMLYVKGLEVYCNGIFNDTNINKSLYINCNFVIEDLSKDNKI